MIRSNRHQADALRRGLAALQKQEAPPDIEQLVKQAVAHEIQRLVIPKPKGGRPGVSVVSIKRIENNVVATYSDGRTEIVGELVDGETPEPITPVSLDRVYREGDELFQVLSNGAVLPVGPIHDGENGIGTDGVGIASVTVTDTSLVVAYTDGKRQFTPLTALIERIAASIELPDQNYLKLDTAEPFTLEGGKLIANRTDGERQFIATLPKTKSGGGGVSQARARAISRHIAFKQVTSDYTAQPGDDVIEAVSDDQAITITVPAGRETWLQIKRSGSNPVTIEADNSALIEGETQRILNRNLWSLSIAWNGSEYREFMGKEVSGSAQTPKHVQTSSAGTTEVVAPSSGKKIRLHYYSVSANPGNTADVGVGLRWTDAGDDFFAQSLSQYGGAAASNLENDWIDGGIDEPLVINLSAAQSVDVNIRYEEVS